MSRGWIQTYTGRQFWPFAPRVEDINIHDVAHGLAMTCRYGGHTKKFYCPTPDQRILTADLRWLSAGDLVCGTELLAFDETAHERGTSGHLQRKLRPCTVRAVVPVKRKVIRLVFADGSTVTSSAEHPWLCAAKQAGNQTWRTTQSIADDVRSGRWRAMNRFIPTWREESSREAGWLAGVYDGEGYFSHVGRSGVQMGLAQNPGIVLDEMRRLHRVFGYEAGECHVGHSRVMNLQIRGGWREYARLLGSIRPHRLLTKFQTGLRDGSFVKQMHGKSTDRLRVVAAHDEGEQWVTGIETSTHTYFCEGFAAHNSVAEHCWHLSFLGPREALLHDSSEAYLGDVPRPIKYQPQMTEFRAAEAEVERLVALHFNLSTDPAVWARVKELDDRILVDEISALMKRPELYLQPGGDGESGGTLAHLAPLGVQIRCFTPEQAEFAFLSRFAELFPEHPIDF